MPPREGAGDLYEAPVSTDEVLERIDTTASGPTVRKSKLWRRHPRKASNIES